MEGASYALRYIKKSADYSCVSEQIPVIPPKNKNHVVLDDLHKKYGQSKAKKFLLI